MNTIMKVLTDSSERAFTRELNRNLQKGWKVAGDSFNAVRCEQFVQYSILLMLSKPQPISVLDENPTSEQLLEATENYHKAIDHWNKAVDDTCTMTDGKTLKVDR